ncbi:Bicupin, oxalate decarboxylase/oxidase [Lentinus brumalis]|uniref:Bicupin, oxalate decarboxylase/oxidase n=1 Tax=Lentinus brumalis TaxID=2498619 RepID=A0A371DY25_9APHY|nr:Bicupin, oxalate decarboxylase/oxidase [Polyporus brumalis]
MPRRATSNLVRKLLPAVLLASILATVQGAPVGTSTSAAPSPTPTVPHASDDPNTELWGPYSDIVLQPQRGPYGAPNHGQMARQQTVADVGTVELTHISELHWHNAAEWAYVLKGTAQISTVTAEGQNYVANVPHSIQATGDDPDGVECLLVFDNGEFNELIWLTDWLVHVPKEVLAKNFHMSEAAFDRIPGQELYIFPGAVPSDNQQAPQSPDGTTPEPYTFDFASMKPTQYPWGTVKVADSRNFKVAKTIAVAEVTVLPGAMRELHWPPSDDEWTFFIEGTARITLFAASGTARTFESRLPRRRHRVYPRLVRQVVRLPISQLSKVNPVVVAPQ